MVKSCIHYFGGIVSVKSNAIAVVIPALLFNSGSCSHSYGGICPQKNDIYIATVIPLISCILGS